MFRRFTSKSKLKTSSEEGSPSPPPSYLTSNFGAPLPSNDQALTSGPRGPILLQDFHLVEKLAHFDRERIPERVVHAKGAGAFGYFESTVSQAQHTKAVLFQGEGKRTPVLMRFSTVGGEKGSSDQDRDPRGFAIKFYTEQGNYDLVGNNTPVFFIRDPFKFPDMVHTHKRNPQTNLKDPDAFWDFFSFSPESTHQVTILFSDRGTPKSFRHMHGFGCHTFVWVNAEGKSCFVKYHFRTEAGVENYENGTDGVDPDEATKDLFEHIESGKQAVWKAYVQIMPVEDAKTYRYDPFDVTKVWRYKDYPLVEIGRLVLDRNPQNFFAEIEQAAFSPSSFIPGVQPSPDKLLQGRLFSYPDTQRHRLGPNYAQIPVNCPYMVARAVNNNQRDGAMRVDGNFPTAKAYYSPNSHEGARVDPAWPMREVGLGFHGELVREHYPSVGFADDFEQAGLLFQVMTEAEKSRLVQNIAGHLGKARKEVQLRQIEHFRKAHADYGERVAKALGES
ncbi:hypothetical protein BASA81_007978 [Batrachochytrium salamandrivorans]|nr:hypothetical protein BASA81_007978 [Batrachochytrium salamandrivorans]